MRWERGDLVTRWKSWPSGHITGQVGPEGTDEITFELRVNDLFPDEVTQVSNLATVSGDNIAQHVSDDPDSAAKGNTTVTLINYADLSIGKQVTALSQDESTLTANFAITVTNNAIMVPTL